MRNVPADGHGYAIDDSSARPAGREMTYGVTRPVYVQNYALTRPLLRPALFER